MDAAPDLIEALTDADRKMRDEAAYALGRWGPPAVPALLLAMRSPDRDVRWGVAKTLGQMRKLYRSDAHAVQKFQPLLEDPDAEVRGEAVWGLLGGPEPVEISTTSTVSLSPIVPPVAETSTPTPSSSESLGGMRRFFFRGDFVPSSAEWVLVVVAGFIQLLLGSYLLAAKILQRGNRPVAKWTAFVIAALFVGALYCATLHVLWRLQASLIGDTADGFTRRMTHTNNLIVWGFFVLCAYVIVRAVFRLSKFRS